MEPGEDVGLKAMQNLMARTIFTLDSTIILIHNTLSLQSDLLAYLTNFMLVVLQGFCDLFQIFQGYHQSVNQFVP